MSYSFSHNHGSGKWLYLKGNYCWRGPFLTSMIMGGSVHFRKLTWTLKMMVSNMNLLFQGLFSDAMLIFWGVILKLVQKVISKTPRLAPDAIGRPITTSQLFGFPPPHLWGLDSKVAEFVTEKHFRKQSATGTYNSKYW